MQLLAGDVTVYPTQISFTFKLLSSSSEDETLGTATGAVLLLSAILKRQAGSANKAARPFKCAEEETLGKELEDK